MVLCTVPLWVLQRRSIRFEPELPEQKLEAIDRLGFGLLNKVAMAFPHLFWGEDLDNFGCLNRYSHRVGEVFLFYSYHTVSGVPVLVAGDVAQFSNVQNRPPNSSSYEHSQWYHPSLFLYFYIFFYGWCPDQLTHTSTNTPSACPAKKQTTSFPCIYEPKGKTVPDPVHSICPRWGSDPFSFGSYSHVRVHSAGSDHDIRAENLGVVSRAQALELQLLEGSGANGLRVLGHSLTANIGNARKDRGWNRSCIAQQNAGNSK
ncbi:putative beta-glucosidase 18-like [Capsicum annuum]|nr:putative beta-glucosidase 18-like [Capsicum annuum]